MRAAFKWRLQNGIYGYLTDETNEYGPFIFTVSTNKREYYDYSIVEYEKTDDNKISSLVSKLSETEYKDLFTRFSNMIQNNYPDVSLLDVSYYYNIENDECVESAASLKCQATDIIFTISGVTSVDEQDAFVNLETINSDTSLGNLEYAFSFGLPKGAKGDKGDKGENGLVGRDGYNVKIENVSSTTETLEHIYDANVIVNDSERYDNNTNTYLHTFGFDFKIPRGKGINENGDLNDVNNITITPVDGIGTTINNDQISITQENGASSVLTNSSLTISSGGNSTTITNSYIQTKELKDNTINISKPNNKNYWYAIYSGTTSPSTIRLGISKNGGERPFEYYIETNLTEKNVDNPYQIGNLSILNGFINAYTSDGYMYNESAPIGIKKFRLRVEMKETIINNSDSNIPKNTSIVKDYSGQWFIDVLIDSYGTDSLYTMSNVQGSGSYISFDESNADTTSRLKISSSLTGSTSSNSLKYGYKSYTRSLNNGVLYYYVTYEIDAKDGLITNNLHAQNGVYSNFVNSNTIKGDNISGKTINSTTITTSNLNVLSKLTVNNLTVSGETDLTNSNVILPPTINLPIGSIIMWPGDSAPEGWVLCYGGYIALKNGSTFSLPCSFNPLTHKYKKDTYWFDAIDKDFSSLVSLIGVTYTKDNEVFVVDETDSQGYPTGKKLYYVRLPNFYHRFPMGGNIGEMSGSTSYTLTPKNIPSGVEVKCYKYDTSNKTYISDDRLTRVSSFGNSEFKGSFDSNNSINYNGQEVKWRTVNPNTESKATPVPTLPPYTGINFIIKYK